MEKNLPSSEENRKEKFHTIEVVSVFPAEKDLIEKVVYKLQRENSFKLPVKIGEYTFILNLKESEEFPGNFEFLYSVKNYGYARIGSLNLDPIINILINMIIKIRETGLNIGKVFFEFAKTTYTVDDINEIREEIINVTKNEEKETLRSKLYSEGVQFTFDEYKKIFNKPFDILQGGGGSSARKTIIVNAFDKFNNFFQRVEDVENGVPLYLVKQS